MWVFLKEVNLALIFVTFGCDLIDLTNSRPCLKCIYLLEVNILNLDKYNY